MLDPASAALLVGSRNEGGVRVPIVAGRCPHGLRLGAHDLDPSVALQFLSVSAIDQAPVRPGLCNQRLQFHQAATASRAPTEAMAIRPSSNAAPADFAAAASTARS